MRARETSPLNTQCDDRRKTFAVSTKIVVFTHLFGCLAQISHTFNKSAFSRRMQRSLGGILLAHRASRISPNLVQTRAPLTTLSNEFSIEFTLVEKPRSQMLHLYGRSFVWLRIQINNQNELCDCTVRKTLDLTSSALLPAIVYLECWMAGESLVTNVARCVAANTCEKCHVGEQRWPKLKWVRELTRQTHRTEWRWRKHRIKIIA